MLHLVVPLLAHVPTYGGGIENCFVPPRHHDVSQVIYLKGSGGLEIHCSADDCPFGFTDILDVDAVFRDEIDQSTYSLYIGCGGCVASADPIVIPPVPLHGYEPAVVEPFTQTRYSSVFPKEQRKYNASGIHPDVCDQGHFTIRLVDHMNRTGAYTGPIVWGAVIGLAESFTFAELMLFPVYVLRNHGDTWNEEGWTIWVTAFVFAPLLIVLVSALLRYLGVPLLKSTLVVWKITNWRVPLYEVAVLAFVTTMLECFIHLNIAAQGTNMGDYGYWVGLLAVILFANGLPLWQVLTSWAAIEYNKEAPLKCEGRFAMCRYRYWKCSGDPFWAPVEIVTGFSYYLLFGAGFYVGPTAIILAGIVRLRELLTRGGSRTRVVPAVGETPVVQGVPVVNGEGMPLLADSAGQRPGLYVRV